MARIFLNDNDTETLKELFGLPGDTIDLAKICVRRDGNTEAAAKAIGLTAECVEFVTRYLHGGLGNVADDDPNFKKVMSRGVEDDGKREELVIKVPDLERDPGLIVRLHEVAGVMASLLSKCDVGPDGMANVLPLAMKCGLRVVFDRKTEEPVAQ
jgi:hypothetical protein